MKKIKIFTIIFSLLVLTIGCSVSEEIKVMHQVTGGIKTNCYLIYDVNSKDAALIDIGGPIDSLITFINENQLNIKYFLFTHGHFDHLIGLPDIRKQFPKAKLCINELDYVDMFSQKEWATENLGEDFIEYLLSDPERRKIYDFNVQSFGEPDIFITEGDILKLGNTEIKIIHSPGHSPGSVCYFVNDKLFSGDVLFYRSVGRVDVQNSSRDDQIRSVKRLYEILPEKTDVYPGHGPFTDILSEKRENKKITIDKVTL